MLTGSPKLLPRGYHELSVNFQTDEVTHVKKEALFDQLERLSDCLLVTIDLANNTFSKHSRKFTAYVSTVKCYCCFTLRLVLKVLDLSSSVVVLQTSLRLVHFATTLSNVPQYGPHSRLV